MQEPTASKSVMSDAMETDAALAEQEAPTSLVATPTSHTAHAAEPDGISLDEPAELLGSSASEVVQYVERACYIPMRLSLEDRRLFNLLEAALSVSDYTDKVDILTWQNKSGRIVAQVKDICSILSGLKVAQVCLWACCVMHVHASTLGKDICSILSGIKVAQVHLWAHCVGHVTGSICL
jgi:hypothetical protein